MAWFPQFINALRSDLQHPLPGTESQMRMAPNPLSGERFPYQAPPADAKRSGVLVLLYPHNGEVYLPLILRPTYDGVHSNQVSFPGGRYEESDGDITATALREAQEEIGIDPAAVTVLGQLTWLYIFASRHLVFPTLAYCQTRPHFRIDAHEVSQLLETPLRQLLDPSRRRVETWQLRDRQAEVPFFALHDLAIWGATAMMLNELLALPAIVQRASHPPT